MEAEVCVNLRHRVDEILTDVEHQSVLSEPQLELTVYKLESLCRDLLVFDDIIVFPSNFVECISQAYKNTIALRDVRAVNRYQSSYQSKAVYTGNVGRPKIDISRDQLLLLLDTGFTLEDIAKLLSVSVRTLKNRMQEYGLSARSKFSDIDDELLESWIQRGISLFPRASYKTIQGFLSSSGIVVQRYRIREIMHIMQTAIRRRSYNVASPLSLWHIDSHHKLIRWRFIIHGGIDVFSRTVVYLHCSINNESQTVLKLFQNAVEEWGLPSRVRADMGVENRDFSLYMLSHPKRGPGRSSFITGKSVHNTRIERLWRDLYGGVLHLFYNLFHSLEHDDVLNPDNDVDLFCLHLIYLPIINDMLSNFQNMWNNHKIRTEKNKTPLQLFITGMHKIASSNTNIISSEYFETVTEADARNYGMDADELETIDHLDSGNNISIPTTVLDLDENDVELLSDIIDNKNNPWDS